MKNHENADYEFPLPSLGEGVNPSLKPFLIVYGNQFHYRCIFDGLSMCACGVYLDCRTFYGTSAT